MNDLLLSLKNISLQIDSNSILADVSFNINKGDIITLIGPNGSGKTSLVKIALNLQQPTSGSCWIMPNLNISYVPQKMIVNRFIPLTVKKLIQLVDKNLTKNKIIEYLAITNTDNLINNQLNSLSGGELQRILLSRALITNPDLLVLDEPMQGVDVYGQKELYKVITQAHDTNFFSNKMTVFMVSHDLHFVMASTTKVICLNKHICCSGTPHQVKNNPEYIKLFNFVDDNIAFYQHEHDHIHKPGGKITTK